MFFFVFFSFYFKPLNFVFSQENSNITINYICLKKTYCESDKPESSACTLKHGHRVQLSTDPQKKFPGNKKVYIAECVYYVKDNRTITTCTTGSNQLDKEIFGGDNFSILSREVEYSLSKDNNYGIFKIENNRALKINPQSFTTNAAGETPVLEWQSFTPKSHERKWYGFFIAQTQEEQQIGQGGLQQGRVTFPPFQDKDCASIAWDPAGRVFDAKTLEPIPNVQVMLLKNYNGEFADARQSEFITNPFITEEDGGFSFFVSDGEYKLIPSHPNYTFPVTSLTEIHQNYQKIYYHGKPEKEKTLIYPAQTGETITVKGKIEFRDIPLKPKNIIGYSDYPLKIYSFHNQLNKFNQTIVFSGKSSHPFTKVNLYKKAIDENGEEKTQVFASYLSDHMGKFNFSIPLSILKENELITNFQFEKSDLTNLNYNSQTLKEKLRFLITRLFKKVLAQQTNIVNLQIDPIFPYLEGFAYDKDENILPNTEVGIYLSFSNVPYYMTKTDDKGYFKIPSTKLPNEPYEIRYQKENKEIIKLSTFEFLSQNKSYLTKNKINLNRVVNEKGNAINQTITSQISPTKKTTGFSSYFQSDQPVTLVPQKPSFSLTENNNFLLLTLLILLILVITVFILLLFYFRKNRSQSHF